MPEKPEDLKKTGAETTAEIPTTEIAPDQAATESFLNRALGRDPEKPRGEKKTPAKEPKTEAKPDLKGEPKDEKKPKPQAKVPTAPTAPDYEKIAEASARGVAQALQKKDEPTKGEETNPYAHLDAKEQRTLKVLEHLQETAPDRYKDVAKKYAESLAKVAAYQAAWEKENPGKEFDPEAEEHNEFFNKVEVKWEDDDYTEALADLKATEKVTKVREELTAKDAAAKEEQRKAGLVPTVYAEQKRVGKTLFSAIGDGFENIIGDDLKVNQEALAKLRAEDPIIAEFVIGQAGHLEALASETAKLFNGMSQYNPENPQPIHRDIVEFAIEAERVMSEQAPEDQLDGQGRKFLTNQQYAAERQKNSNIDKQFWTYTAEELNDLRAAQAIKATKQAIKQREEALAKSAAKRGFQKGENPQSTEEEPPNEPETEPEQVEKPHSPEMANDSKVSSGGKVNNVSSKSPAGAFLQKFIS